MTTRSPKAIAAALLLFAQIALASPRAAAATAAPDPAFSVRMVKLVGNPNDRVTIEHVRFCRKLGFNALWLYGYQAGAWTKAQAPNGPILDPGFLRLVRWCRRQRMEPWVSVNPTDETGGKFIFTDPDGERRVLAFIELLHRKAGVRRFVISFDDQPTSLRELSDVFRYGLSTAPAHLELTARIAAALPPGTELWLCPSAYADVHLGDGTGLYSKPFLEGLPALPKNVGIVWTGPEVISPSITRADIEATRARLGGRRILLYDNFPINDDTEYDSLALLLGALRNREPGIRDVVAAYLACPDLPLAGLRLSLITIAEFLRDPVAYDPQTAAKHAVNQLAGRNAEARTALETQQLEWGGFIGGLNYWPRDEANPEVAAHRLYDPAYVDSFTWTVSRYPDRMKAIEGVADTAFRDDLIRVMRRRLAIARVVPLTVEYFARMRARRPDAAEVLALIADQRRSWDDQPDTQRVFDLFVEAADLPGIGGEP